MWKFIRGLIGITLLLSIAINVTLSINEAKKLDELRQTDPDSYLRALKDKDDIKWMLALKELDASHYSIQLEQRIRIARALPAAETIQNLQAYRALEKLEPNNQLFAQKVEFYESKLSATKTRSNICNTDRKSDAYLYSKEAVQLQLKSPRSAKFGSYGQTEINLHQDCIFIVKGYVDSQNGFGAIIRSQYDVRLKASETGWTLKYIDVK